MIQFIKKEELLEIKRNIITWIFII
jgi:hypothetical protein